MAKTENKKSDVAAKNAYIKELENEGYTEVEIKAAPADIKAIKDNEVYYFEIKMTRQKDNYFGAATLTEWLAALKYPNKYFFVIAQTDDNVSFRFTKYSPSDFMEHSTIPPFKIYFNLNLKGKTKKRKRRSAIQLTEENLKLLSELHEKIK